MPRLTVDSTEDLRRRLDAEAAALPFAAAVAAQLAHPPGTTGDAAAERAAADRVVSFLEAAAADAPSPDTETALLDDPTLLSAVFQNLDLLHETGAPGGDGVARLLARLVDRAEAAPRIDGILETCLYADEVDRAADFYTSVLGIPATGRAEGRHVFLRCGDRMLLLFDPSVTERPGGEVPPHGARGPGHVAFAVHDGELPRWRDHLVRLGVEIEREVSWPRGGSSLYLRDPAGNSVELTTPGIWGI